MATNKKSNKDLKLTHTKPNGIIHMVDISSKPNTKRIATAIGKIYMQANTLQKIVENQIKKGDVICTAKLAGIMAAKHTAAIIPLCHQISLSNIEIDFKINQTPKPHIIVTATVISVSNTGVEIEALLAVNICLLTIYDMAKAIDRFMTISDIKVKTKLGGKSGHWINPKS